MIPFQQIKPGDFVRIQHADRHEDGIVTNVDIGSKQVCVDNGVQEFWYEAEQLLPLPVNDDSLKMLKFQSEKDGDVIKYMKGAFRIYIPRTGDFSKMNLKYRDEIRQIRAPIHLHELQNHYYEMTKVHLDDTDFE